MAHGDDSTHPMLTAVAEHDRDETESRLTAAQAELDRIRFTLDVIGTVDLDTGLLNRNGIYESIQRAQRWLARRADIYGVMFVAFPDLDVSKPLDPSYLELMKHLAATIAAGVRDVDEVGRASDNAFCAVLADLHAGALRVVTERVTRQLERVMSSTPRTGEIFRIGGLEVLTASHTYGTVLDTAQRLSEEAEPNQANLSSI